MLTYLQNKSPNNIHNPIKKGFGIVFALGLLLMISGLLAAWLMQEQGELAQYQQAKRRLRFGNITEHSLEWFGFLLYLDGQRSNIDSLDELWATPLKNERLSDLFKTYPEIIEQDPLLQELALQGQVIDLNRTLNLHQVIILYGQFVKSNVNVNQNNNSSKIEENSRPNELKETNNIDKNNIDNNQSINNTVQQRTNESLGKQIKDSFFQYHDDLLDKNISDQLWNQALKNPEQTFAQWYEFLTQELKLSPLQLNALLQQTTWINTQPLSLNINTASIKLLKFFMPEVNDGIWQNFMLLRQKTACKDVMECENRLQTNQKTAFLFELTYPWSFPQFSVNSSHFLLQGMVTQAHFNAKNWKVKKPQLQQNQESLKLLKQEIKQSSVKFPIIALYDRLLWERIPEKGIPLWYQVGQ